MKNVSLIACAAVILLANGFALIHATRNRSGTPEAEVVLTDRDLVYYYNPENTGVTLHLRWHIDRDPLLNQAKLRELGFDLRGDEDPNEIFRHLPRPAYAMLGYDPSVPADAPYEQPRLKVLDVARDPAALRARYPNRRSAFIIPARVGVMPDVGQPARAGGYIRNLTDNIHVPQPFSSGFLAAGKDARYRVHLRYGQNYEPWVTGVEFLK